jgi:hypothetical protein
MTGSEETMLRYLVDGAFELRGTEAGAVFCAEIVRFGERLARRDEFKRKHEAERAAQQLRLLEVLEETAAVIGDEDEAAA